MSQVGGQSSYSHQDFKSVNIGKRTIKKTTSSAGHKKDNADIVVPPKWNRAFVLAVQKARSEHIPPLKQRDLAISLGVRQHVISEMESCKGKYNNVLANRIKNYFKMGADPCAHTQAPKKVKVVDK